MSANGTGGTPPEFQSPSSADLESARRRFLLRVPKGGRILDVNSGCGHDTLEFLRLGYQVDAFDASPELCECSTAATGVPARCIALHELPAGLRPVYHGVWASAALLRVNGSQTSEVLRRLGDLLVPGGMLYLSALHGGGACQRQSRQQSCGARFTPEGRYFHTTDRDSLVRAFHAVPALRIVDTWFSSGHRLSVVFLFRRRNRWIHALAVKSQPRAPVLRFRPLPAARCPSGLAAAAALNAMQDLSNPD